MTCCDVGSYKCSELAFTCECCGHSVFVDKCLLIEIRELHHKGIRTLGCCCGHGTAPGYIQVSPECCDAMDALGYIMQPEHDGIGKWCYEPRSETIRS